MRPATASLSGMPGNQGETQLLEVHGLHVSVGNQDAVTDLNFSVGEGKKLGIIGESGSGKTLTALAIMGLLADGIHARGRILYRGEDLLRMNEEQLARIRGDRISMVFQEPMSALNPVMRVGDQIGETLRIHRRKSKQEALTQSVELMARVGIRDPEIRAGSYPHQLSGGQRQRVVIAIALACNPDLLIADEPTTALDVTVQARILQLLRSVVEEQGISLVLISHDLPVVAAICEEVLVMHRGRIVEAGPTDQVFSDPRDAYTKRLLESILEIPSPGGSQAG